MAYGQAQAFASRKPGTNNFGKGDPRGVIAPSAASNGIESGSLIPTLLFGVPGAAPFALLLGVLLIFGIQPGPGLITNELDLVYFIVWAFAIASVLGAAVAFVAAKPLARLSYVAFPILAAALIPLLFFSGFQEPLNLNVFYMMLLLGVVGWICKMTNIPRAPFLIAYVLAEPFERYYFLTVNVFSPAEWMTRPFVMVVILILAGAVIIPFVRKFFRKTEEGVEEVQVSEKSDLPVPMKLDIAVSLVMLVFFAATIVISFQFSNSGRLFPLAVGILGVVLGVLSIFRDIRVGKDVKLTPGERDNWRARVIIVLASIAWIVGYIWLIFLFGMLIGTVAFSLVFLLVVARMRLIPTIIYTLCIGAAIWVLAEYAQLVLPVGYLLPV